MIVPSSIKNEDGHLAVIGALVLLTLLTVVSISASLVAKTEVAIARNEFVYRRNFYLAEGAALEAADHLGSHGHLGEKTPAWMERATGEVDMDSVQQYWGNTVDEGDTVIPEPSIVDPNHTLFMVAHEGTARGFSLSMDRPTVHALSIYGRCAWSGVSVIKMGYQAAY